MDIFAIIKEGLPELPEGVSIPEKAIKAIEKEIKQQQALEFVPKEQYNKKVSVIDDMKSEMEELLGKSADGDSYKDRLATLEEEYKNYKVSAKKEHDDYVADVEANKEIVAKRGIARKWLIDKKMDSDVADDFMLDKLDYSKMDIDGDSVKDAGEYFKPYQEKYGKYFKSDEPPVPQPKLKITAPTPGAPPASGEPKSLHDALSQKYK